MIEQTTRINYRCETREYGDGSLQPEIAPFRKRTSWLQVIKRGTRQVQNRPRLRTRTRCARWPPVVFLTPLRKTARRAVLRSRAGCLNDSWSEWLLGCGFLLFGILPPATAPPSATA